MLSWVQKTGNPRVGRIAFMTVIDPYVPSKPGAGCDAAICYAWQASNDTLIAHLKGAGAVRIHLKTARALGITISPSGRGLRGLALLVVFTGIVGVPAIAGFS
jgi:hypothetical protein